MASWSLPNIDNQINQFDCQFLNSHPHRERIMMPPPPPPPPRPANSMPPPPAQVQPSTSQQATNRALHLQHYGNSAAVPKGENPREMRNRAEKMRRDRLNKSVADLQALVPPVIARRKSDKTTVLRLTAHFLRANQYVFGDSVGRDARDFRPASMMRVLNLFNGFMITVTYRGLIVSVSQTVHEYLRYSELDLLGQNLLNFTHEHDRYILRDQLMPRTQKLGPNGELLIPDEPGAVSKVEEELMQEKRQFVIRLKKNGHRSEPVQYVSCQFEGSMRKSDRANSSTSRCCQIVRRARARSENPCSSGNDIVFIGMVRPTTETFMNESAMECYRMEYRTRHSIDGQIIQTESRIALVTGYMMHEVNGMNAMNFMHRDDMHWVVIALREMYDKKKMFGESCYRLITKNGKFIYMRTRGRLDVDKFTGDCTSFICTNTEVSEKEGKAMIKYMKQKYAMTANTMDFPPIEANVEEINDEINNSQLTPVEDPRRLEKVILSLVTDIPSTPPETTRGDGTGDTPETSNAQHIKIIPPTKENIVGAINRIYNVIYCLQNIPNINKENPINRSASCPAFDLPVEGVNQDNKVIDPGQNNSNETHNSGEDSYNALNRAQSSAGALNVVNPEPEQVVLCFPNLGYLDQPTSGYSSESCVNISEITEPTYNNGNDPGPKFHATDPNINNFPFEEAQKESTIVQNLSEPNSAYFPSGTKRHIEYEDEDYLYKKKNTEVVPPPQICGSESQNLEDFLEELFNTQIETAISTTESLDAIDPTFPDLLVSAEVQDILRQLESDQQNQKPPEFD